MSPMPTGGPQYPREDYGSGGGGSGAGYGRIVITPPSTAVLTAVNHIDATIANEESGNILYLQTPTSQGVVQGYVKAKAGALAKLTVGWFPGQSNGGNSWQGIYLRNATSGLGATFGIGQVNSVAGWYGARLLATGAWTSDILNTNFGNHHPVRGGPYFVQVEDDGTSRIWRASNDEGRHWQTIISQARTDHAIFDQVGIGICSNAQAWTHHMTVLHWTEA